MLITNTHLIGQDRCEGGIYNSTPSADVMHSSQDKGAAASGVNCEGEGKCVDPVKVYPIDLHINTDQLIQATSSQPIINIVNTYKNGWPLPTIKDCITVTVKESKGPREHTFNVYKTCFDGVCSCRYVLDNSLITLKPCRMFTECFMWGEVDCNWSYLMEGTVFGFRIVNPDCPCEYENSNYNSILKPENKKFMSDRIKNESDREQIIETEVKPRCIHAIGAVDKKKDPSDTKVSIRPITDCSRSGSDAPPVNEYCNEICERFVYKSLDDVCDLLHESMWLCSTDISDAYRGLHIYYGDRKYQGLKWDLGDGRGERTFIDARLCFGMASGPYVFNAISEFIVRCMFRKGYKYVVNYLDDFLIMEINRDKCIESQLKLFRVIRHLGFSLSFKKISPVSKKVVFLGIEIDSVSMRLTLPDEKMSGLLEKLSNAEGKLKLTKQEVQSLAGSLAHASKVVKGGRCFTRRIYDLCNIVEKPYHKIRLSGEARADIRWWLEFAKEFNGSEKIIRPIHTHLSVYSDSSFAGFAAQHGRDWLMGVWDPGGRCPLPEIAGHHWVPPPTSYNKNINELEFWPVLLAAKRWGHLWRDCELVFVTDNTQVMHMLNTGRSTNKKCMQWIREMFWLSVKLNFHIKSVYIPTKDNIICDSLSRWGESSARARLLDAVSPDSFCCYMHL